MSFPDNQLNQKCVYWGNPVNDGYGSYTFDDPVELDCRWVNTTDVVIDAKGNEVVTRASVQLSQDVVYLGRLWLGELDDLDSDADPMVLGRQIIRFDKTPTVKADAWHRMAYL